MAVCGHAAADGCLRPELIQDRLQRAILLGELVAASAKILAPLSDTRLHLGNLTRPVLLAMYEIVKPHAKRDPAIASKAKGAIDFFAAAARAGAATRAQKKRDKSPRFYWGHPRKTPLPRVARPRGQSLCPRGPSLCLRGQSLCLRGPSLCPRGQSLCPRGQSLCLRGQSLCLRGPSLCPEGRRSASEGPPSVPAPSAPARSDSSAHVNVHVHVNFNDSVSVSDDGRQLCRPREPWFLIDRPQRSSRPPPDPTPALPTSTLTLTLP